MYLIKKNKYKRTIDSVSEKYQSQSSVYKKPTQI